MLDRKKLMAKLAPGDASIFYVLRANTDISIDTLYRRIEAKNYVLDSRRHSPEAIMRYKQQRIGAYISRINNNHLIPKGWVIRPGEKRYSYRLQRLR